MPRSRKKRKSSGNISLTKAQCPYCSKFFQYLNQHWSQNSNCSRLHDARNEISSRSLPVSGFASLRDETLFPNLPVSGDASLRGPRDIRDPTISLQSFVASRAAMPPPDLYPVDYPSADDSDGELSIDLGTTSGKPAADFCITPPGPQLPGISTVPVAQLQVETQWFVDFSSMAMSDDKVLFDFGQEDESESSHSSNPANRIVLDSDSSQSRSHNDDTDVEEEEDPYPVIDVSDYMGTNRFIFDPSEISYMRLWDLLDRIHAPLYAFDELLSIVREESLAKRFDGSAMHPSRRTFFQKMISVFGNGVAAQCIKVQMETDDSIKADYVPRPRDMVNVYVFDATKQALSLLQDMGIMSDLNNLSVDVDNPFGRYKSRDGCLGEVNSGKWYDRAFKNLINEQAILPEFLIGVILYADKTGTSVQQRHGLEPIMMTFSLFQEHIRNQTFRAWRPIGYIPDLEQGSAAEKRVSSAPGQRGRKYRNYHACLGAVLRSLESLISDNIVMYLTLGHQAREVRLIFSVSMFMGDGKSSDTLCCRVPNYKQARTARACYTSYDQLGTPRDENAPRNIVDCKWVKQIQQRKLLVGCQAIGKEHDQQLLKELALVSTVRVDSPMFNLCYGDSPYGQYFACTVDMMHAFEHGVVVYVLKTFVEPISGPKKKEIDKLSRLMFSSHRSSERDTYPRTNFTKGVTHLKLMKCYEWPGFLLVYLILAQSYQGSELLKGRLDDNDSSFRKKIERKLAKRNKKKDKLKQLKRTGHSTGFDSVSEDDADNAGPTESDAQSHAETASDNSDGLLKSNDEDTAEDVDDKINDTEEHPRCTSENFVTLMSQLLTFHAYYKQKTFWKKSKAAEGEQDLNNALMVTLRQLRNTLSRETGNGWNISKIHEVFFHLVRQIRETGRPSNCDCQVGERGLKVWGKHHAQRTNKGDVSSFTKQVTQRMYESATMARAQNGMDFISKKMVFHEDKSETLTETSFLVGKPKYQVLLEERADKDTGNSKIVLVAKWHTRNKQIGKVALRTPILKLYREAYFSYDEEEGITLESMKDRVIQGYTECNHKGTIYRSHPNLQNNGPFYDWAVVKCPNNCVDIRFSDFSSSSQRKQTNREKKAKNHVSYITATYGRGHVPARILALYCDPITGVAMALVHACRPQMVVNVKKSGVITESWHLQHVVDEVDADCTSGATLLVPFYNPIPITEFVDRILVYLESPSIESTWVDDESSGHVILVTRRSTHWASTFLSHNPTEATEEFSDTSGSD